MQVKKYTIAINNIVFRKIIYYIPRKTYIDMLNAAFYNETKKNQFYNKPSDRQKRRMHACFLHWKNWKETQNS